MKYAFKAVSTVTTIVEFNADNDEQALELFENNKINGNGQTVSSKLDQTIARIDCVADSGFVVIKKS